MAGDSKEAADQLGIQQQINKVLSERAGILDAQAKQLSGQVQLAAELCKALECKDLDQVADRLDEINAGLQDAASNAQNFADNGSGIRDSMDEAGTGAENAAGKVSDFVNGLDTSKVAAGAAAVGIVKGMKSAAASISMANASIGTMVSGLMNVGKAIIAAPFSMLGGLVSMASAGGGGVSALAKATEELRGQFGDLATGEGKAVMDGFADLTSSSGALAQTGLSVASIYGRGSAGVAAAMKDVAALAEEAGGSFSMLKDSIAANAGQMLMMNKGLGMTNAALVEMTRQAQNSGQDVGEMLTATASMAIQMGDKFGISAKTMGKNMASLTENFSKLGKMSTKELGATAAYMAKLGLEATDLLGVVDKFDNFEDAAGSVSHLNQAFGMQLDAMEMMNAENPAERIDMMRKAFDETGKSVEDMTRQEKALLAEQMGLSVSAMENALAAENQGVSYEDLEAGAGEAEEQALTQEEAMSKLADSIEKMTEGGGQGLTGFFDAFTKGFAKGLKDSKAFQDVLKAIREAMKIVFQFGKQVGKMFSELMGDMGVWDGIKDLFDPKDLRNLMGIDEKGGLTGTGLLGIFKKFKDALSGKGNYSPQKMAEDMGKEFGKFFSAKGPAFSKLKGAFIKGIQMIGALIAGFIPFIIGKLVDMITGMADALRNPKGLGDAASSGIGGAIINAVMGIGDALMAALPSLIGAILNLLSAAAMNPTVWKVAAGYFAFMVGKSLLMGAIMAAKGALFKVVVGKLSGLMSGATDKAAGEAEKGGKSGKKMGKSFKQGMSSMAEGLKSFIAKIADIKPGDILRAMVNMTLMALSFLPAMAIFALGLVMVAAILSMVKFSTLIKGLVGIALGAVAVQMVVSAAMLIQPGMVVPALIGLLAGALLLVVGGTVFTLAMGVIGMVVSAIGIGTIMAAGVGLAALAIGAVAVALAIVPFAVLGVLYPLAILASVGLIAGAMMLAVGGVAFTEAVGEIGKAVQGVGIGTIMAAVFGLVALGVGAIAAAGAAYAFVLGLPFFAPAIAGGILGAAFLVLGGVPFMVGVALFSEIISGMEMGKIAKAMLALVILTAATVGVAWLMTAGLGSFIGGTVGAVIGALFMFTMASLFMPQLAAAMEAAPKDMKAAVGNMIGLAILMLPAVATAWIMGAGASAFAVGTIGAVTATMFFWALALLALPAINAASTIFPKDMMKAATNMGFLAIMLGFATLAAIAFSYGAIAFVIGAIGAVTSVLFFKALSKFFIPAFNDFMSQVDVGTILTGAKVMSALALVMVAAALMAVLSLVMIIFANPIVLWLAGKGLKGTAKFLDALVEHLGPAISSLSKMKVGDPSKLGALVEAISKILQALGENVDIVIKIAMIQAFSNASGSEGNILKDAESFMTAMFTGMTGLLNTLKQMVSSMSAEDIEKMEAIGGLLGAIGTLMTALQPPPALMEAMADLSKGGLFKKANPKGAADMMKSYGATMSMILESVKDNIPPMIAEILKIDIGKDPELAEAKAKVVGAAMQGAGKLVEAIGGIAKLFMDQNQSEQSGFFNKSGPTMADTLRAMKPVFAYIFDAIKGALPGIITAVIEAVPADIDAKAAEAKIAIVAGAMEAVANFAEAIGTVSELMPPAGGSFFKKGKTMSERLGEMMQIIRAVVNAARAHIGPLVKSVLDIPIEGDPKASLAKLEVIGKAMSIVGDFANVVGTLSGLGAPEDISGMMGGWISEIQTALGGGDANMGTLFSALGTFQYEESSLEKLNGAISTVQAMADFASAVGNLSNVAAAFAEGGGLGAGVAAMVTEVNAALVALNGLGAEGIDANVALENFAGAIGTGGGEFTISNEPVNITINMNVTMDANKVGKVLVDKSVMTSPLAQAE